MKEAGQTQLGSISFHFHLQTTSGQLQSKVDSEVLCISCYVRLLKFLDITSPRGN